MDALLRRRAMIAAGGVTPPIPTMAYIRGGGDGSYIDTGITPDQTTKVVIWARNWNPSTTPNWLFGSRIANLNSAFALFARNGVGTGGVRACYGNENFDDVDQWPIFSHYHKYELSADGFYVDDSLVVSVTAANFSNNYNIFLYALNNASSANILSTPADIVACKIYKGGNLVRDYSPAESPSVGLYDAVSGTLFTNAGSGSFTYGTFNPDAYTPLDCIKTSGSSYFLSPAIGTYSLPIVAKFKAAGTGKTYYSVFGGRDTTNRCEFFLGDETYSCGRVSTILGTGSATDIASNNSQGYFRNKEIICVKNNNSITAYNNNTQLGNVYSSSVGSSYTTNVQIGVAATYKEGNTYSNRFVGDLFYIRLGDYNLVPGKVGGVAGMYDTYNDIFYTSISGTPFTAGNVI